MLFQSDGNGGASFYSLGNAVDGVVNTFVFRATQGDCDLTNTQLVALNNGHSANFITLEEGYKHTVNMFSTNNWGGGDTFAKVHGGTANFFCAALQQNGNRQTFDVPNGGKFNMYNFNVRSGNENCNGNKNVSLYSGVFTPRTCENLDASSRKYTSFDTNLLAAYTNMLPVAWNLTNRTGFITDRSKWHVIAFNDIYGKVYDRDGNLVEGQQSKTFVFGDDEYYSNEGALYNRLPGDGLASRATDGDMSTRWSSKGPQSAPIWVANYKDDKVTLDETMPYKSNPLQWYTIFFDQDIFYPERTEKINAVILDASESSNDGPSAWRLQVYVGDEEDENEIIYHTDKTPDALKNKYPGAFQDYEEVTDEEYEMYDGSYGQPHTWKTVASGSSGGSLLICPFPEQECKGVRILQMGNKGNYWSMEEVYVGNIAGLQVSGIEDTMLNEEKNLFFAEGTLIIAASLFNADGTAPVEIYDLAGRMVRNFTATTGQITLDDLNKGVYIVRVKGSSLKFMN